MTIQMTARSDLERAAQCRRMAAEADDPAVSNLHEQLAQFHENEAHREESRANGWRGPANELGGLVACCPLDILAIPAMGYVARPHSGNLRRHADSHCRRMPLRIFGRGPGDDAEEEHADRRNKVANALHVNLQCIPFHVRCGTAATLRG